MLKVRDLVKIYPGGVTALQGVNLDIEPGLFGLLGPNGAGKTTLMRILTGLLAPSGGTVEFEETDVVRHPERLRARLGYLPQEFGFYPHLSGEAMLAHLLTLKGVTAPSVRNLARDLLERVNLGHAARRRVGEYSGGMRQRLGIAQAIAGDPALLIVDEPTAGLDPEERNRFYGLLGELAADRTVLLSTHIVEDVAVLCRRFALIAGGRVLVQTTPADARARLDGSIFAGEVAPENLPLLRSRYAITQSVLREGIGQVRIYVPPGDTPPAHFSAASPTLEDVYLSVVTRGPAVLDARPARPTPPQASPPQALPFDLSGAEEARQ